MPTRLDARSVTLHIQLGIEEVRANLASLEGLKPKDAALLAQCIAILNNIWEITHDYAQALDRVSLTGKGTETTHDVATDDNRV